MTTLNKSLFVAICLAALLLLVLAGCGGGNSGIVDTGQLVTDRQSTGVTMDGFEVLRYNREGFTDPALNGTIGIDVSRAGDLTAVTISVSDPAEMNSVIVNVNYDSASTHPERAEFTNLLGARENVLSAAFLDSPGTAGLGSAAIRDYMPGFYTGDLVTLYFADGPSRNVSAIGDVHSNPFGVASQYVNDSTAGADNLFGASDIINKTASVSWTAAWHCADGDQNSETNAADLVPLALFFGVNTNDDWSAARADYDLNSEVNASDIVRIGRFFGEKTNSFSVTAGDNDGSAASDVVELAWNSKNAATGGAAGELTSAFDYWEVNFDGASTFSYDDLAALDVDGDGMVRVYVTPITLAGAAVDQTGAESSIDLEVAGGSPTVPTIIISEYDIEIVGADDGTGGTIFDGDGTTPAPSAAIVEDANSNLSFRLNSIRGTFNSVAFTEGNLATGQGMTQTHYDNALDSARENLSWTFSHAGHGDFRRTEDWIDLNSGNPNPAPFTVQGDPGAGTVFPDDDPESIDTLAEGTIATTLPQGNNGTYFWDDTLHVQVLADKTYNFTVDIDADEEAPLLLDYSGTELVTIINQNFSILFEWGSNGEPGDLNGVDLQLVSIGANGMPETSIIDFDYQEGGAVNGREFSLRLTGQSTIECIVPGASLQGGKSYAFRFFDGTKWSSINKPEALLTTAPPPPPEDLIVVPDTVDRSVNYIQIFYDDPVVRRNGFFIIDLNEGTALPENEGAYNDQLKINGQEFPVAVVSVGNPPIPQAWPQVRIGPPGGSGSPVNPNIITSLDYEGVPGILIPLLNGNRIIVDIRVVTGPPQPGDDDEYYALKLFNADGSAVGQGQFYVPVLGIAEPGPTGVGWALNVFNREEKELGDRDYVDRTLDSSRVGTAAPDVMWVEFQNGWVFDAFEGPADRPYDNVHVYLKDQEAAGGQMDVNLSLRVVGLTPGDAYLAIHEIVRDDYFNLIIPGFGILRKGHAYDVSLDDNRTPAIDYNFPLPLLVTGDLPPAS